MGLIDRWRDRRDDRRDARLRAVLGVIARDKNDVGLSAIHICDALGWPHGTIHADLARLERLGQIRSWWEPGQAPRRRLYGRVTP